MSAPAKAAKTMARRSLPRSKAKATTAPRRRDANLEHFLQQGLADARAVLGLANGLHALFAIRLSEAEVDLARLGKANADDNYDRYRLQVARTADLRTWVGVLDALKDRAFFVEGAAKRAAEHVGAQ